MSKHDILFQHAKTSLAQCDKHAPGWHELSRELWMNTEGWKTRAFQVVLALCVLFGIGAIALSIQEVLSRQRDLQAQKEDARKIAREQASRPKKRVSAA